MHREGLKGKFIMTLTCQSFLKDMLFCTKGTQKCRCILSFVQSSLYISPFPVSAPNMLSMRWTWSCP